MKNEPVLIWTAILVSLQVLFAGVGLANIIGANAAAFGALSVASLQAGTSFYIRGQVTPTSSLEEH